MRTHALPRGQPASLREALPWPRASTAGQVEGSRRSRDLRASFDLRIMHTCYDA